MTAEISPLPEYQGWIGSWVTDRLGAQLVTTASVAPELTLDVLVGLAIRRNPKRVQLLVSRVLGKHIPTDPLVVYGAGRLLGCVVRDLVDGRADSIVRTGGALLAQAVAGDRPAAEELVQLCDEAALPLKATLVFGYAETATALGHCVADSLQAAYLHSTRRRPDSVPELGEFEEAHSHASGHSIQLADAALLEQAETVVLVDDELSTGRTALNTIRALHAAFPNGRRYVVAALVDLRTEADVRTFAAVAAELGVSIEVASLASGTLVMPDDAHARGAKLVERYAGGVIQVPAIVPADELRLVASAWPAAVGVGGRHGFRPADRFALERAAETCARDVLDRVDLPPQARLLVLGTEELLYAPLRLAMALARLTAARADGVTVWFSSTTRSPVAAIDEPGYAIRTALRFESHDDPRDGPGQRFAYNVGAGEAESSYDVAIVVLNEVVDPADTVAPSGVLRAVSCVSTQTLGYLLPPDHFGVSSPVPLRGPHFGSYAPDEVAWLLTDLSHVELEAPIEEREEAIAAGGAHYAESLPIEYQPDEEYQALFRTALTRSSGRIASAVGIVTELSLARRGEGLVLVSLARAGTPIGILMRRWAERVHGLALPHYAVSIVRGRGIDVAALEWLAARHDPWSIMFVDGWTGKGAITRELVAAIDDANHVMGLGERGFRPEIAVLADPGNCVELFGTREDYLIPSACLNSTVSGLVSRTVLNDQLIGPGQFHGAKFYSHLAPSDVSAEFLDAISSEFDCVRAAVERDVVALAAQGEVTAPTWAGWREVERIGARYGINDHNLIKPGVGETTRVLLRRVPWRVLMRTDRAHELDHVRLLAERRGVEVEFVDDLAYSCVGLIHPQFTRAATGADGLGVSRS